MFSGRSRRSTAAKVAEPVTDTSSRMSRPRRTASAAMASVSRDPPSSPNSQSLRLTVKVPAQKLRAATGGQPSVRGTGNSIVVNSRDPFVGGDIIEGKRSRNVKKSYILESDSDQDDEEMDDVGDDDDDDGAGESAEEDDDMDDEDAEGEEDADGDVDMDIPPPPPIIKVSKAPKSSKPVVSVKPSGKSDGKSVEQKEAPGSDDEELSELDSDLEDDDEGMQLDGEEDAEGEDEEIEVADDDDDDDDDELDSDDETPMGGSRASTPDLAKLTKRQRARLEEGGSGHLMALPDEVQVKKHLTAEEHAMRRAEMARRRKNLSEKRNEEEKMETINKLLKKQAPKTNARRQNFNSAGQELGPDGELTKPNPIFVRWISNKDGNRVSAPEEWMDSPVGAIFGEKSLSGAKLIEEVQ